MVRTLATHLIREFIMLARPHTRWFNIIALALVLSCAGAAFSDDKPEAPASKKDATGGADYTYSGKVVKVNGLTLTIHSCRGPSDIIHDEKADDKTVVSVNGKAGKLDDFKEGDWVKIYWNANPKRVVKIESTQGPDEEKRANAKAN